MANTHLEYKQYAEKKDGKFVSLEENNTGAVLVVWECDRGHSFKVQKSFIQKYMDREKWCKKCIYGDEKTEDYIHGREIFVGNFKTGNEKPFIRDLNLILGSKGAREKDGSGSSSSAKIGEHYSGMILKRQSIPFQSQEKFSFENRFGKNVIIKPDKTVDSLNLFIEDKAFAYSQSGTADEKNYAEFLKYEELCLLMGYKLTMVLYANQAKTKVGLELLDYYERYQKNRLDMNFPSDRWIKHCFDTFLDAVIEGKDLENYLREKVKMLYNKRHGDKVEEKKTTGSKRPREETEEAEERKTPRRDEGQVVSNIEMGRRENAVHF